MTIEHIGLWVTNLEEMRQFYETYFNGAASERYHNSSTGFSSYFIQFKSGARLELMHRADICQKMIDEEMLGFAHLALSLGSKEKVDTLTYLLVDEGYNLLSPTRTTGDGYYESVIADPEGNRIELTI